MGYFLKTAPDTLFTYVAASSLGVVLVGSLENKNTIHTSLSILQEPFQRLQHTTSHQEEAEHQLANQQPRWEWAEPGILNAKSVKELCNDNWNYLQVHLQNLIPNPDLNLNLNGWHSRR